MPPLRIVEPVDVLENSELTVPPSRPMMPPDQFSLDGLEESLDDRIVKIAALAALLQIRIKA